METFLPKITESPFIQNDDLAVLYELLRDSQFIVPVRDDNEVVHVLDSNDTLAIPVIYK